MTHKITQIAELKKYLIEMIQTGRAGDSYPRIQHAPAVSPELVVQMAGYLIMYADDNTIEVGVRTNNAGIAQEVNQLWFYVQGRPWAIVYSSRNARIELRARSKQGNAMHSLNKFTRPRQVATIFASL